MSYEQIFRLDGQRAIVAGASRGIGLAIARALAASGAHTVMAARSAEAIETEAAALRDSGHSAEAATLDITDPEAVERLAVEHPETGILINVAGTNVRKRFEDYTPEEYASLLETNLHGVVRLTQAVGKRMLDRGKGGKIIFIGSLTSTQGLPFVSVYTISKSALGGLTKALAAEWGLAGIQVNCICPGFILTDLNRKMWQPNEMREWLKSVQANPELGDPGQIAPLAVFLASRAADYITGQLLFVDGGYNTTRKWPFEPSHGLAAR